MPMSSTPGDPAAFGPPTPCCVPMLSNDDAATDAQSRIDAAKTVLEALSRTAKMVEVIRALILRAEAIMPQLEQRQADELRNEVRSCINNGVMPHLNDIVAEATKVLATLKIPLGYLCEEFAKLAKIQHSKRQQFDGHVAKALTSWACAVNCHSRSGSAAPILGEMKRNLTDVYEKLANPNGALSGDLHFSVWSRLSSELEHSGVVDILNAVGKSIAAIERALARGHERRGPSPGVRQYPEVDTLVFSLELGAQLAGRKFTAHKMQNGDGKGTMIEALNLLRTVLPTELAEAIPLADQHPISTYKRAIKCARNGPPPRPEITDTSTILASR